MNKKGITVIEILVSFILISIIVVGMLNIVYLYRGKISLSNYKKQMIEYKNNLTKDIYTDILMKKVKNVRQINDRSVEFEFGDSSKKILEISDTSTDTGIRNKNITYGGRIYKIYENLPNDQSNLEQYEMIKFTYDRIILTRDDLGTDVVYHIDINMNYVDAIDDIGIHLTFLEDSNTDANI